jgi:hypothetical protein
VLGSGAIRICRGWLVVTLTGCEGHDRRSKRYEKPLPGRRVQIDVKFIAPITAQTGRRRKYYQFTAIDDCTPLQVTGDDFLLLLEGARSALGPAGAAPWQAPRRDDADPGRAQLPPGTRGTSGERCAPGAPPAALRPCRATAASAASRPRGPPHRLSAATINARPRSCKGGVIRPAVQCEADQDHAQRRFASHVIACGQSYA